MITVRWGKDEKRIFNSNCTGEVLRHYIRKCANVPEKDVDIADSRGVSMRLHERNAEYASTFLKARDVYVLVKYTVEGDGSKAYSCLLDTEEGQAMKIVHDEAQLKVDPKAKKPGKK